MKKEPKKAVKSCLKNNTSLSGTAVLTTARSRIGAVLPLQADGCACTTEQLSDVLSAVSVGKGRLKLAIKFVLPGESVKEVVGYLLNRLQGLEIEIKCLYLDRGFEGVELVRYLKEIEQTAIIVCPLRGTTGGIKALCVGKKSYRTKHFFKSAEHGIEEVETATFKGFTTTTKKGGKVRRAKWLAYILIEYDEKPSAEKVKQRYRKRFGIEAGYRCAKKVREAGERRRMPTIGLC